MTVLPVLYGVGVSSKDPKEGQGKRVVWTALANLLTLRVCEAHGGRRQDSGAKCVFAEGDARQNAHAPGETSAMGWHHVGARSDNCRRLPGGGKVVCGACREAGQGQVLRSPGAQPGPKAYWSLRSLAEGRASGPAAHSGGEMSEEPHWSLAVTAVADSTGLQFDRGPEIPSPGPTAGTLSRSPDFTSQPLSLPAPAIVHSPKVAAKRAETSCPALAPGAQGRAAPPCSSQPRRLPCL